MTDKERGDIATRFQKGNQFWKARSTHGRNPIYDDPQKLQDAIEQYFEWVHENPLIEYKPMIEQGSVSMIPVPKMRPMLIGECARFCGLSTEGWATYKKNPDFIGIISAAEETINNHKLSGALSGFFKEMLVARLLGIKDTSNLNINATVKYEEMSDDDLDRQIEDLSARA